MCCLISDAVQCSGDWSPYCHQNSYNNKKINPVCGATCPQMVVFYIKAKHIETHLFKFQVKLKMNNEKKGFLTHRIVKKKKNQKKNMQCSGSNRAEQSG